MATTHSTTHDAHIKPKLAIDPEEYMQDRAIYKMERYARKSMWHKYWYQWTSVAVIVFSASVPVLINLSDNVPVLNTFTFNILVPTLLSLAVTILVSLEKLFHFREHWRNYDAMAAFLRSEQLQFQTHSGAYREKSAKPEDAFRHFVKRIEEGIKEERNDTIAMRTREVE